METSKVTQKNDRRQQAKSEFTKIIENICRPGFYGTASVTVNVQDGHVQYTRVVVDRMVR